MALIQLRSGTDKDRPQKNSRRSTSPNKKKVIWSDNKSRTQDLAEEVSTQPNISTTDIGKVILIVDDTPTNLQVLFTCLEKAGYRVLVTQNGENAIKIAESQRPDLILLDVLMPGMDGFDTCDRLKAKATTRDIPIIFLTALSETVHKLRGFEVGGVDYVTKPIQQEELLARIHTHLKLQQMQQKLAAKNQELEREINHRKIVEAELIERQQQLQQSLDFTATIGRITDQIRDTFDESEILTIITQELVKILPIDGCQIELYDREATNATIAYEYSPHLPPSQGIVRQIKNFTELYQQLLQKSPIQFVDISGEFSPQQVPLTRLAHPIFERHNFPQIIGNLWLLKSQDKIFTDREIELVKQLATNCAIAIRQARLYAAEQRQVSELARLNRLKDEFLKTISHELRAPMTRIKIGAETLHKLLEMEQQKTISPTFTRVMRIFRQACEQQNQLVDDLLSLCYLEDRAENITFEIIDLPSYLPKFVDGFRDIAQDNKQELILDITSELPLLSTDISILERILTELVTNACKYTPSQETISVLASKTHNAIEIKVTNTGVEIPPEELQRIFDQFYRIPNHDPWQYGGTGLGLTLVKKLAALIESEVKVESNPNFTSFSLLLPILN
jgi:signal transduction histidine kinase/DNA-binding response OmpR family regulator